MLSDLKSKIDDSQNVVFVSGNFNVVHPGHLRMLRFASECGDFLIVGVNDDSIRGVTLPQALRLDGVSAISFVDHAFILETAPEAFIAQIQPAIVVMGKEHENRSSPEKSAVDEYGGKVLFGSGESSFSSLELLHREYIEANYTGISKPTDFPERHDFEVSQLKNTLEKFSDLNVLVIGDLIVDEYITCDPLGMSQEDPTVVVTPIESKRFIGGAGIVAAHASSLGSRVTFLSVAGRDDVAEYAETKLSEYDVECEILRDESRPTTLKMRYRAAGKTLLRVSYLRQHAISNDLAKKTLARVKQKIAICDIVIFSDFNYGCLPQNLVDEIIMLGEQQGVLMVADSQASSQISDVSRFKGMTLLTPTEREARLAQRDYESGLVVLAEKLATKSNASHVAITLGEEGLLVLTKDGSGQWKMDNLPAFNSLSKDASGAGDSFLTCASLALCVGENIWRSVYLGSLAAGIQVSRLGNTPLKVQDFINEIEYF
jgi:rfaE bifunctional protein kinase chain/domain